MAISKWRSTPVGATGLWIRDLSVIGATCALAPAAVIGDMFPGFVAAAAVVGALSGALLGAVLPALLLGPFSRLPIALMLVVGAGLGALWGGGVGAAAGATEALVAAHTFVSVADMMLIGAVYGAVAGALQLGWFWLPYTLHRARDLPAWPVVLAASAASLGLGWAAELFLSIIE